MKRNFILIVTFILTILLIYYEITYYVPRICYITNKLISDEKHHDKSNIKQSMDKLCNKNLRNEKFILKKDLINIVFFGLDARDVKYPSRSDSIIVVSIDVKRKNVKLISLMRDMYVSIPGKKDNRINAAYAFGGVNLALSTINRNFGLDIDNYVTVDFYSLEKIIDKIGGVNINVSKEEISELNFNIDEINDIKNEKCSFVTKPGLQKLNGRQAVAYARMRYTGNGDYQRTQRQRSIINEIYKKVKEENIAMLVKLIYDLTTCLKTNLSSKEIIEITLTAKEFNMDNLKEYRLPADGTYRCCNIRGMSVLVPDIKKNKKLIHEYVYEN